MSVRNSVKPVSPEDPNRLARVLAAGLTFGVHGKRERESPEVTVVAKRLRVEFPVEFATLPDDVVLMVARSMVEDDPCGQIKAVCLISTAFANFCRSDGIWKLLCEVKGYDRDDRTTGYHQMADPSTPMRWKAQFVKWCGLRFATKTALGTAVRELLENDPTGAADLGPYGPIGSWDVSMVTDMSGMFCDATSFNGDVSKWTFPEVTDMSGMFCDATSFNGDVSKWTFPEVTDMNGMFLDATSFNGDVSKWTFPEVTDMSFMFEGAISFSGDVSKWTFPKVTNMSGMFEGATSFNGEVSEWTFPEVVYMSGMFRGAPSFNGDVSKWTFPNVTNMSYMFYEATSFNGDVSKWTFPEVITMEGMFRGATSFNGDVSKWTFPQVTNMSGMFAGATSFNQRRFSDEAIADLRRRHIYLDVVVFIGSELGGFIPGALGGRERDGCPGFQNDCSNKSSTMKYQRGGGPTVFEETQQCSSSSSPMS